MSRSFRLIAICLFITALSASAQLRVELRQMITGLTNPVAISHAGDSRLFITQQRGQVVIWNGTQVLPTPFLNISSLVSCCGERGLLSIVFHPRYRENGFFYVNYTDTQGNTVVARYSVMSNDPDRADPASALVILRVTQPFANHNGGLLKFGPDGYLYIGMGDGGSGGDPQNNGQSLSTLLGKILRIDVDSGSPYAIPPSNPFVSQSGARGEIWAYGLRNPWKFSFDRQNGDLWIADVGQNVLEEVNLQLASSRGGENYGWRRMEGTRCFNPSSNCQTSQLTLPVVEYSHEGGNCSVTGGYRYRGSRYPLLRGLYLYADYCTGTIWGAREEASGWRAEVLIQRTFNISTFGEDMNGELYVASHNGGSIHQIVETTPVPPAGPRRRSAKSL